MRYVVMLVLVAGCATDGADDDHDPRVPLPPCMRTDNGAVVMPAAGATVPPPNVDITVRWTSGPSPTTTVHLVDAHAMLYLATEERTGGGIIVYHYVLPPNAVLTFGATEICFDGDATMPKSHLYEMAPLRFNTGP